jgi:hypothetical protein
MLWLIYFLNVVLKVTIKFPETRTFFLHASASKLSRRVKAKQAAALDEDPEIAFPRPRFKAEGGEGYRGLADFFGQPLGAKNFRGGFSGMRVGQGGDISGKSDSRISESDIFVDFRKYRQCRMSEIYIFVDFRESRLPDIGIRHFCRFREITIARYRNQTFLSVSGKGISGMKKPGGLFRLPGDILTVWLISGGRY